MQPHYVVTSLALLLSITFLGCIVSAAPAAVISNTRCDEGHYLHGTYSDETRTFSSDSECRRCLKDTYNTAKNNTSLYCAACRHECNAAGGEIQVQQCLSIHDRKCECDASRGYYNRAPYTYLDCSNNPRYKPSTVPTNHLPREIESVSGQSPVLDNNGVTKCAENEDETKLPNNVTLPTVDSKFAMTNESGAAPVSGGSYSSYISLTIMISLVVLSTVLVALLCLACRHPARLALIKQWVIIKCGCLRERWRRSDKQQTEADPMLTVVDGASTSEGPSLNVGETDPPTHGPSPMASAASTAVLTPRGSVTDPASSLRQRPTPPPSHHLEQAFCQNAEEPGSLAPVPGVTELGGFSLPSLRQDVTDGTTHIDHPDGATHGTTPDTTHTAETSVKTVPDDTEPQSWMVDDEVSSATALDLDLINLTRNEDTELTERSGSLQRRESPEKVTQFIGCVILQDNSKGVDLSSPVSNTQFIKGDGNNVGPQNSISFTSTNVRIIRNQISNEQNRSVFDEIVRDRNHVFAHIMDVLMENLSVDLFLLAKLMTHNVISDPVKEEINKATNTIYDKAALTLSHVKRKGIAQLGYFIIALYDTNQKHVSQKIIMALMDLNDRETLNAIVQTVTNTPKNEHVLEHINRCVELYNRASAHSETE